MYNNKEVLLPTRDFLRQLIGQSNVSDKELSNILRNRGVFTGSNKKDTTGTILIKTGVSPFEYTELRESYKTKEESPKTKNRRINWESDAHLLDAIPNEIDYTSMLNDQFGVFSVSSMSGFTTLNDNPDHIYMDFEIERKDVVRNWGENVLVHEGRIEIRKLDDGKSLNISLTHTAPETRNFGDKIAETLVSHFKEEGHINKNEAVKVIRFSDFTNEKRVEFFNVLTQKASDSMLQFIDTRDIHFSPDHTLQNPPQDIAWMKDKIDDMKIKGKGLHSTFFVSDAVFHPYIQLFSVQCDYSFKEHGCNGTCRILFEFSDKDELAGAELTLNLSMLKLDTNSDVTSKFTLKKQLIESIEKFKMECYDKYKSV